MACILLVTNTYPYSKIHFFTQLYNNKRNSNQRQYHTEHCSFSAIQKNITCYLIPESFALGVPNTKDKRMSHILLTKEHQHYSLFLDFCWIIGLLLCVPSNIRLIVLQWGVHGHINFNSVALGGTFLEAGFLRAACDLRVLHKMEIQSKIISTKTFRSWLFLSALQRSEDHIFGANLLLHQLY